MRQSTPDRPTRSGRRAPRRGQGGRLANALSFNAGGPLNGRMSSRSAGSSSDASSPPPQPARKNTLGDLRDPEPPHAAAGAPLEVNKKIRQRLLHQHPLTNRFTGSARRGASRRVPRVRHAVPAEQGAAPPALPRRLPARRHAPRRRDARECRVRAAALGAAELLLGFGALLARWETTAVVARDHHRRRRRHVQLPWPTPPSRSTRGRRRRDDDVAADLAAPPHAVRHALHARPRPRRADDLRAGRRTSSPPSRCTLAGGARRSRGGRGGAVQPGHRGGERDVVLRRLGRRRGRHIVRAAAGAGGDIDGPHTVQSCCNAYCSRWRGCWSCCSPSAASTASSASRLSTRTC